MTKAAIQFKHVQKRFGDDLVIPDLSFTINQGEFVTILGTSGSGKTTTLKMVNGLLQPSAGEITIDGRPLSELDLVQLRRHMGYVVQQIGLFPHMTIAQNIAVVAQLLHWNKEYATRYPSQLSGGQQQRVGVARALVANPPYVLFDEPFGALDALTREELQHEIKRIHESLADKTFMFVTHDINEALYLGSRVMVMHEGRIEQFATPAEIVRQPATPFVKKLLGTVRQNQELWGQQDD